MRDTAWTAAYVEAGAVQVDQQRADRLARAAPGLLDAGDREQDDEVGRVGVADEVLRAVDDVVAAVGTALVCMERTSEPASGSVIARQSWRSPRMVGSR
jgi:hypothetical protein